MFEFAVTATDGAARTGTLETPHGTVQTPCFMPVGTHGAVKGVSPSELAQVGSQVVLANTYHLYLRPGEELIASLGGVHGFTGWPNAMLTDSGGFQVFSLGERGMKGDARQAMRRISEDGVTFQSHLDGSRHLFTAEKSVGVQQKLGADISMAFDQPVYGLSDETAANEAMERSMRWLVRSKAQWQTGDTDKQALFGIVQGGIYRDVHRRSAEMVAAEDLPGNAIGGLSVGEGKDAMWEAVSSINEILPSAKPRYFMGLGEPYDLVDAVARGVDMFDCVAPSRLARHGSVWMPVGDEATLRTFWNGNTAGLLETGRLKFERWNLHNARFRDDTRLLAPERAEALIAPYSRAALHHFLDEKEMVGYRILTMHNIELLHLVTGHAAEAVRLGRLSELQGIIRY